MAYDSARGRVVLFGGRLADSTSATDTWEWDGAVWSQRATSGPPARVHHSGGFDAARGRFVVHGGQTREGVVLTDTWEWDGASWAERATTVPADRALPSRGTVFSSPRGTLLMAIGDLAAGQSDLWEWNGTVWTAVDGGTVAAESPMTMAETGTAGEALALDEAPHASSSVHTWRWSGTAWAQAAAAGPPARFVSALAYDAARGRVVLFGGSGPENPSIGRYLDDTWLWNGAAWQEAP
jgi:hypothetical protein